MRSDVPSWWPAFVRVRILVRRARTEAASLLAEASRVSDQCEDSARRASTKFAKERLTSYHHDIQRRQKEVERLLSRDSIRRIGIRDFEKACTDFRNTLNNARDVMARDLSHRNERDRLHEECLNLREQAAPVLVGIAKQEFERCRASFESAIRRFPASKQLSEVTSGLKDAAACVEKMRHILQRVPRVQSDLVVAQGRAAAIDPALLATDPEAGERYRMIIRELGGAEQSIARGDFSRGEALIQKAQVDLAKTSEFLEKASKYAREELIMWREFANLCPAAAAPYAAALAAIPPDLTGDHLRRWQELKGEIDRVVQTNARRTRAANAALLPRMKGLQLPWGAASPQAYLGFGRAVRKLLRRRVECLGMDSTRAPSQETQ